jgi:transcriptional repressor NrdR
LQPFDRAKLRAGIDRAASGRLDAATIATLVTSLEEELRAIGAEVPSDRVGMAVLEHLRGLDPVAYMRFASVYKGFDNLADFEAEVVALQKTTDPKPH